jgi:hypothetical protein
MHNGTTTTREVLLVACLVGCLVHARRRALQDFGRHQIVLPRGRRFQQGVGTNTSRGRVCFVSVRYERLVQYFAAYSRKSQNLPKS